MLTRTQYNSAQKRAVEMIRQAGIVFTAKEANSMEVADFGLSRLEIEGAQIMTLFSTGRMAAKVIALFPNQTLPQHWHNPVGNDPGKEETVRAVKGDLRLYVPGEDTITQGHFPHGKEAYYTSRHEHAMAPGDQLTLAPGTEHWFQAGPDGAVLYSFTTCAHDQLDGFTDPGIKRETIIQEVE